MVVLCLACARDPEANRGTALAPGSRVSGTSHDSGAGPVNELKRAAAEAAAGRIRSGMVVGLGTGSTAIHAVASLGERLRRGEVRDVRGVPTSYQSTVLARELHMIEEPERWVEEYADAGADIITVHAEAAVHLHRALESIRRAGKKAAVGLNPATPIEHVRHVLDLVDMVLIMSVNPGFGGQSFIPQVLEKIAALRAEADARRIQLDIEVDGGIKIDNVDRVARAGANVIVSGSGIFLEKDYRTTIARMRERAELARR